MFGYRALCIGYGEHFGRTACLHSIVLYIAANTG